MIQDRGIQPGKLGEVFRVLRSRRLLVIAASLLVSVGIIAAALSAVVAIHAPLDIRGFLGSEKTGNAYGPDFTDTWVWAAVAAIGIAVLIVGLVRGTKTRP